MKHTSKLLSMIALRIFFLKLPCLMIAEGLRAPRFFSPFRSQTPIKITPKEFYPKSNSMIPRLWNNADKPGEDGWVKEMLDMSIAVFIT